MEHPEYLPLELNCIIRPGTAEDLILLVETWDPGSRQGHLENLRRCFRTVQKGHRAVLVVEANGYPVGQMWIVFKHSDSNCHDGSLMDPSLANGIDTAYLHTFDVFKYFRGLGIGKKLYLATEKLALERGFKALTIGVEPGNTLAQGMYRRWGFKDWKIGYLYGNRILYLRKVLEG